MRRLYPLLAIGSFCLVVVGLSGWSGAADLPAPRKIAGDEALPAPRTLGVSGCASTACHGRVDGGKGGEYTTWVTVDRHAQAYRALSKPESKLMHENLAKHDSEKKNYGKYASAADNPLCLKCHAMGPSAAREMQVDGVGCERCHGPAEHWKSTHYLDGFDRATPGFRDLRTLESRALTCVKCHVGDSDQEVNHDLIAAGHPRLRFEFAAYHANYPRHWDDRAEKASDPGFEARAWAVGQLVSARAALELLASRTKGNDPITGEPKPWPEFAEYECAACHHGLSKPSFRQERDAARAAEERAKGKAFRGGDLPWGTWYYPLVPLLAGPAGAGQQQEWQRLHDALKGEMARRLPPAAAVRKNADEGARLLGRWLTQANKQSFDRTQVLQLFTALSRQDALAGSGWDGGAQVYLGLAAAHNALTDLDPAFQEAGPLLQMRKDLRDAFDRDARPRYDTPRKYDPQAVRKALAEIRERRK